MSRRAMLGGSALALVFGAWSRTARAADPTTQRKAAVLARALSYEHTLRERVHGKVDVLLVYADARGQAEAEQWRQALASLDSVLVAGKQLATRTATLETAVGGLEGAHIEVVVACGPMDDAQLEQLSDATAAAQVLSVGTRRQQVERALTFAVLLDDDKMKMLVNLRAAKREGIRFSSKLLRLAEVLR